MDGVKNVIQSLHIPDSLILKQMLVICATKNVSMAVVALGLSNAPSAETLNIAKDLETFIVYLTVFHYVKLELIVTRIR